MKYTFIGLSVFVFIMAILVIVYFFVFDKTRNIDGSLQENYVIESVPEYTEQYVTVSYSKSGIPQSLDTIDTAESKIFIEKITEEKLVPANILQVGNELYFVSPLDKDGVKGDAIMLYDVIDRKLYVLFFRSLQELLQDGRELSLVAIDVVNSKLIFAYILQEMNCSSVWLGVSDYLFSLELYTGIEPKIEKYRIPTWKIEEERAKYPDCVL